MSIESGTLHTELAAWQHATNTDQRQVQWQFTTADARINSATYTLTFRCDGLLMPRLRTLAW